MAARRAVPLLIVVTVLVASSSLNAAIMGNMKCWTTVCGQISQTCAYGGTESPPPCTYCSGQDVATRCGWHAEKTCNATGEDYACGLTYTGLCSNHQCSGGTGSKDACMLMECGTEPPPP